MQILMGEGKKQQIWWFDDMLLSKNNQKICEEVGVTKKFFSK